MALSESQSEDLKDIVSQSDKNTDINNSQHCNRNHYRDINYEATSSRFLAPMSPRAASLTENIHILDLIKNLWSMNEGPLPHHQPKLKIQIASKPKPIKTGNQMETKTEILLTTHDLMETNGCYSCWDFVDIMASVRNKNPLTTETGQEKKISKTLETLISTDSNNVQLIWKLDPDDFKAYLLETTIKVGRKVVFFIEEIGEKTTSNSGSGTNLIRENIWKFRVVLIRPDASNCQLLPLCEDPTPNRNASERYYSFFYPTQSGSHFLCAYVDVGSGSGTRSSPYVPDFRKLQGNPFVINVNFDVEASAASSNSRVFESISTNQSTTRLCVKAWGIAVYRPYNWIFVADQVTDEIVVLDSSDCKILYKFGKQGSGPRKLYRPTGIAVDSVHERVIVTDKDNHRIAVFGLHGDFLFNFGNVGDQNGEFNYPWGVAVSSDGQFIAVADSQNHRIQLFNSNGEFLRKFSVSEDRKKKYSKEFNYPRGVAFSLTGNYIYVTDYNLKKVYTINLDRTEKTILFLPRKIHMSCPQGLSINPVGNVFIVDSKRNCVHVFSETGIKITTLYRSKKGRFNTPLDVAVLEGSKIVVLDIKHRLHII